MTDLLEQRQELFDPSTTPFTHIIVASPFSSADVLRLPPTIPVILVTSVGFMGSIRMSAPTQCIIETHPESLIDLRLFSPWPELSAFAAKHTQSLDTPEASGGMTNHLHGHVPYVALLLSYLEEWKSTHENSLPSNYSEKNEFKSLVLSKMRTDVPGGSEENYEEAVSAVLKNLRTPEISSETKTILEDPRTLNPTVESSTFWILANALRSFINDPNQGAGLLPLSGAVPDMKAESAVYVELQTVYRARAQRDAQLIFQTAQVTLERLGRASSEITLEEVTTFAKHANYLQRINYRPLSAQLSEQPDEFLKKATLEGLNGFSLDGELLMFDAVAFRAWQEFLDKEGRAPGDGDDWEADVEKVLELAKDFLGTCGYIGEVEGTRTEKVVKEFVRAGGRELHVLGALIGGMAAQEMTKVSLSFLSWNERWLTRWNRSLQNNTCRSTTQWCLRVRQVGVLCLSFKVL